LKKLKLFALALMFVLLASIPAMADQVNVYQNNQLVNSVVFKIGVPEYVVNGQTPGVKMDVAPFIQNDRTFVPVRFLGNALGIDNNSITWDSGAQTVTLAKAGVTVKLTVGSNTLYVNSQPVEMDVAPVIREYPAWRVYLPARFVAEAFGYAVDWNAAAQSVLIGHPTAVSSEPTGSGATPAEPPKPPVGGAASGGGAGSGATPAGGKTIDMTAARNGTLQPPPGAVAPPDKWGFPAKALRAEFKVGERYATVTRTDGSKYQLDLGTAAVVVSNSQEGLNDLAKKDPGIYNETNCICTAISGKLYGALYAPFIPVAEAFGVPKENIVWDGEHLAVFGWDAVDGYRDGYKVYEAGKREAAAKWHNGEVTIGKLNFPLFVKDGVPMVGINSVNDFVRILYRAPGGYCSIVNIWQGVNGGWDYKTGIAATAGEL
jgi:hypothetical protein